MIPHGRVRLGGCQAHTSISPQPPSEVAEHVADHGANGPEVVLAAGVAPSRRWAQQWYGLVVGVAWSSARHIDQMCPPSRSDVWGCGQISLDAITNKAESIIEAPVNIVAIKISWPGQSIKLICFINIMS